MSIRKDYKIQNGKVVLDEKYTAVIRELQLIQHGRCKKGRSCMDCEFNLHILWIQKFEIELKNNLTNDQIAQLIAWFRHCLELIHKYIQVEKKEALEQGNRGILQSYPVNNKSLLLALERALA